VVGGRSRVVGGGGGEAGGRREAGCLPAPRLVASDEWLLSGGASKTHAAARRGSPRANHGAALIKTLPDLCLWKASETSLQTNRFTKENWNVYSRIGILELIQYLTHNSPQLFGVKFSLREIQRIFSIKIRNFKLWEMPK